MRLLHLLSQRPELTGSGIYLQAMLREAARRGHENFVLAGAPRGEEPLLAHVLPERVEFIRFGGGDLPFPVVGMSDVMPYPSKRFRDLTAKEVTTYEQCFAARLQDAAARFNPQVIHSHHLWLATATTRRLFPDLPVVATCHGSDLRQFHFCENLSLRVAPAIRRLDRIMALSRAQKADIQRLYQIPGDRVEVVGAGYNEALFYPENKSGTGPVQMLYAGKLSRAKGVPWLLLALAQLLDLPWHLHLVGGGAGEEAEEVLSLAASLRERVTVHGPLPQETLAGLMRRSHVVVLPSLFEGLPLVVLEALAAGCRVVATALPGVAEVTAGTRSGAIRLAPRPRLVAQDQPHEEDEEEFVANLAAALTAQVTAAKREDRLDLGEVAGVLHHYSWGQVFTRVERIYARGISGLYR